jgi:uncharacterized membrane protein YedE/YeeE
VICSAIAAPLVGGVLIGLAASMLLLLNGRIAGISGIVAGVLRPLPREWPWQALFVLGLVAGGGLALVTDPGAVGAIAMPFPILAIAGLLVGFGTRLAGGCTSGHGVCGVGRGSARSIAATTTFLLVACLVVLFVRHGADR